MSEPADTAIREESYIIACCSDIAGKVRGKAFPESDLEKRLRRGIGWTPTNVQITCFDLIADTPFGALGDLQLIPDPATHVDVALGENTRLNFMLGDILKTDRHPWECCTRSILKAALARLRDRTGLTLTGAFEHEFHIRGGGLATRPGLHTRRLRGAAPFRRGATAGDAGSRPAPGPPS